MMEASEGAAAPVSGAAKPALARDRQRVTTFKFAEATVALRLDVGDGVMVGVAALDGAGDAAVLASPTQPWDTMTLMFCIDYPKSLPTNKNQCATLPLNDLKPAGGGGGAAVVKGVDWFDVATALKRGVGIDTQRPAFSSKPWMNYKTFLAALSKGLKSAEKHLADDENTGSARRALNLMKRYFFSDNIESSFVAAVRSAVTAASAPAATARSAPRAGAIPDAVEIENASIPREKRSNARTALASVGRQYLKFMVPAAVEEWLLGVIDGRREMSAAAVLKELRLEFGELRAVELGDGAVMYARIQSFDATAVADARLRVADVRESMASCHVFGDMEGASIVAVLRRAQDVAAPKSGPKPLNNARSIKDVCASHDIVVALKLRNSQLHKITGEIADLLEQRDEEYAADVVRALSGSDRQTTTDLELYDRLAAILEKDLFNKAYSRTIQGDGGSKECNAGRKYRFNAWSALAVVDKKHAFPRRGAGFAAKARRAQARDERRADPIDFCPLELKNAGQNAGAWNSFVKDGYEAARVSLSSRSSTGTSVGETAARAAGGPSLPPVSGDLDLLGAKDDGPTHAAIVGSLSSSWAVVGDDARAECEAARQRGREAARGHNVSTSQCQAWWNSRQVELDACRRQMRRQYQPELPQAWTWVHYYLDMLPLEMSAKSLPVLAVEHANRLLNLDPNDPKRRRAERLAEQEKQSLEKKQASATLWNKNASPEFWAASMAAAADKYGWTVPATTPATHPPPGSVKLDFNAACRKFLGKDK